MLSRFKEVVFTADGNWVCPSGITQVLAFGQGGGAAGDTGGNGAGGLATNLQPVLITVVPGTTYPVVVGAGGVGVTSSVGNAGGDSSFGGVTWKGAPRRNTGTSYNLSFVPFSSKPYTGTNMALVPRAGITWVANAVTAFGGRTGYSSQGMPGEDAVGVANSGSGANMGGNGSSGKVKIMYVE